MQGLYYDGKRSSGTPVDVQIAEGRVRVQAESLIRVESLQATEVSEKLANVPVTLLFADGAFVEITDGTSLEAALAEAGHRRSQVELMQGRWRAVVLSAMLLILVAVAGYHYGIPVAANFAAERLPRSVSEQIANRELRLADDQWLNASKLPIDRQRQFASRFTALKRPSDATMDSERVLFRSAPKLGPNAITLPDGSIVLFDELIEIADNDDQLMAVLCHEAGHAHYRHGMRGLLQGLTLGAVLFAWAGDANALIAGASAAVLHSRYSRTFETEADGYAVEMLALNDIPVERFTEILLKLSAKRAEATGTGESTAWSYISTHPATQDRIAAITRP